MTLKTWLLTTAAASAPLIIALGAASTASAQATAATNPVSGVSSNTTSAAGATTVGEVVVTTRRQTERLQDVPLAVTAITAVELEQAGVQSLADAAALTPGLLIANTSSESGLSPNSGGGIIRGIADVSGAGNPTVGVFFNGVALPNPNAVSVGIIDLERIEIVKGPVSALYGRGAFAGAINYVTKQPSNTLEGHVTGEIGNAGKRAVYGEASGPLIKDVLSFGIAGTYDQFDGTYKDQVNGLHAGGHDKEDVRGSFLFTPTNALRIFGGWYHGEDSFNVEPQIHSDNNCGAMQISPVRPVGAQFNYFCGQVTIQHPVEVANISASSNQSANKRSVDIGDLHVAYDFGFATASAIIGYNKVTEIAYQDFTTFRNGIPFLLIGLPGNNVPPPAPGTVNLFELFGSNNNNQDFSTEVRLASRQDQRIRWAIGGYYSTQRSTSTTIVGEDASQLPAGYTLSPKSGFGLAAFFLTPHGQPSTSNLTLANFTDKQLSPFASLEVDPLQNLTAFAEVRYTDQTKSLDPLRNDVYANTIHPNGATAQSGNFYFINYRGGVRYKFTSDISAYASIATGEKAGGFNQRAFGPLDYNYAPETNTTYETGLKSQFLQRRVLLNAAIFYIQDNGLQVFGPSHYAANPGTITTNYGDVTSKGFELEGAGVVNDMITLTGSLAYADPIFGKNAYDFSAPAGDYVASAGAFGKADCGIIPACNARLVNLTVAGPGGTTKTIMNAESLKGLQTPFTSKWMGNAGVNFKGVIMSDVKWFGRAEYRYESKRFNQVDNLSWVAARNIVNLSAGLTKGPVSGIAYANNLTNDETPLYSTSNARLNDFGSTWVSNLPQGRTYGVRLTYTY